MIATLTVKFVLNSNGKKYLVSNDKCCLQQEARNYMISSEK